MSDKPVIWEERFRQKIGPLLPSGCRDWLGRPGHYGYGQFSVRYGDVRRAHRLAWELENGPIPDGLWVLHTCDRPICVNVDHLFLGTAADNARDRDSKGRGRPGRLPGERHPRAKLTDAAVREIRRTGRKGRGGNVKQLAAKYGVTESHILVIINQKGWTHVA